MEIQTKWINPSQSLNETLKLMNEIELESFSHQSLKNWIDIYIRPLKKCNSCFYKNYWQYMRNNFNYEDDPEEHDEFLYSPRYMILFRKGDCDDFALLTKTTFDILNIPNNYILLGKIPNQFTHIAVISNNIIIDPVSPLFNYVNPKYKFKKIVR